MKYIDMFIIIIIRIPVTQMFTNIAHFYFCLCWHSFFLFICNNRRAWFEFCAFASIHINMWMLKINKDNLRLCSVYHKFHETSLRGIGCSFHQYSIKMTSFSLPCFIFDLFKNSTTCTYLLVGVHHYKL